MCPKGHGAGIDFEDIWWSLIVLQMSAKRSKQQKIALPRSAQVRLALDKVSIAVL